MKKEILYTYTGTNGTVTTPVFLEGVPNKKRIRLVADSGKILTNGTYNLATVIVTESTVNLWTEVEQK